jgi:hypothetical protein
MTRARSRGWLVVPLTALALGVVQLAPARTHTTAPNIYVNVNVTLTDTKVTVSPTSAPRGSDARFIVRNVGSKPHLFTIGSLRYGTGVQTGFTRVMKPGAHGVFLVYLDYRGLMRYYSDIGANARTPTYKGTFAVGLQCSLCVQDN